MRRARDFVGLIRSIRLVLAAAERDWRDDPEMPDILRRMAGYMVRLLCGEPEPRSAEDARRALRVPRPWKPQGGHGRNGNGVK